MTREEFEKAMKGFMSWTGAKDGDPASKWFGSLGTWADAEYNYAYVSEYEGKKRSK